MTGSVVVFGATGFTGELVARALVRRGASPVLAGRNPERLASLSAQLGGLETRTGDVNRPDTVYELVEAGDVVVSTVGPFVRRGRPAVDAAVRAGATYLDSTGEPPFVREVLGRDGDRAAQTGALLLPAFGYDYVPGNLAGALALRAAGEAASRLTVAYFVTGRSGLGALSGGTLASVVGLAGQPSFAFRCGRLVTERPASRVGRVPVRGRSASGVSVGGTEHVGLPRLYAGLCEVEVLLGWAGRASRAAQLATQVVQGLDRPLRRFAPGVADGLVTGLAYAAGRWQGPDAGNRSRAGTLVVAVAADEGGRPLARAEVTGPEPYTLTGELLAWAALESTGRTAPHGRPAAGALTPVEAFGLDRLAEGCESLGLVTTSVRERAEARASRDPRW